MKTKTAVRKSAFIYYLVIVICNVITVYAFTTFLSYAINAKINQITIVATVKPLIIIVVDKDIQIQKIYSNTTSAVRPLVVLEKVDGEEVPYTDSIRKQYGELKPTLNFDKPGVIYEKNRSLSKVFGDVFGKLIRSPF